VRAEIVRIQAHAARTNLHNLGDGPVGQPAAADLAALGDRAKQRPGGDLRGCEPVPYCGDGAGEGAAHDRDGRTLAFLVGLALADGRAQAPGTKRQVGDIQGNEFGASERPGEAEQK